MHGDFSRLTFDPRKRNTAVLMQQGRVQSDADFDEAQHIHQHRDETEATDVIGPTGVPRVNDGFAVGLAAGGAGLTLSAGHLYVDGVLCVNDDDGLSLTSQPDLPGPAPPAPPGSGVQRHLVYLDAWQRHISAIEDPSIRETALGGPDTATRSRTVWQVRLHDAPGATCAALPANWPPRDSSLAGQLTASATPAPPISGPCVLPPSAGFRGLENQLYRVEIHTGGVHDGTAAPSFKWSRENGSVTTAIVVEPGVTATGPELTVASTRLDDILGFAPGDWVEVIDDRTELDGQPGTLARIDTVQHASRRITLNAGTPALALQAEFHPKLRRWDQRGVTASANGVALPVAGTTIGLEDGIEVTFTAGEYQPGDYWVIPARSAIGADTGSIEWPRDGAGVWQPQPRRGIQHHYAALALVDLASSGAWTLVPQQDCRMVFPPLTAITAADVSFDDTACQLGAAATVQQALDALCQRNTGGCAINLVPGPNWAAPLAQIADDQDVDICFQAGDYPVDVPVVLASKGHLKLTGAGTGTRIVAAKHETAIRFERCKSVNIRDLSAEGGFTGSQSAEQKSLNGALTFRECGEVELENVHLACADGPVRAASCVTVLNTRAEEDRGGAYSSIRIRSCDLTVGYQQAGVLLINAGRAQVEDNLIRVRPTPLSFTHGAFMSSTSYRAGVRNLLLSEPSLGAAASGRRNVTLDRDGHRISFRTANALTGAWATMLDMRPPDTAITSDQELLRYAVRRANDVLAEGTAFPINQFSDWHATVSAQSAAVGSQGIVLGGTAADDARIINNTILGMLQGIHVGFSQTDPAQGSRERAGRVRILGNTVEIVLPVIHKRDRHGIFAGNFDSLLIENNDLSLTRVGGQPELPADGIRAHGSFGALMIVRQNQISDFTRGIRVHPLNYSSAQKQWLVADNVAPGSGETLSIVGPPGGMSNPFLVRKSGNFPGQA